MDLISYDTIRAVHRIEKDEVLQKLPHGFFESVQAWMVHKEDQKDTDSLLEINNAKRLIEDIINRRERKIVMAAIRTMRGEVPPSTLTDSEREFFDKIINLLKEFRRNTAESILAEHLAEEKVAALKKSIETLREKKEESLKEESKPEPKIEKPKEKPKEVKKMIKILSKLNKFVGMDMKEYGPYDHGDIIDLPDDVSELLIKRGAAEKITA